jgi:hypothetical protein
MNTYSIDIKGRGPMNFYGYDKEEAIANAIREFGAEFVDAENAQLYEPQIMEYVAVEREIIAYYDDGTERVIATAEDAEHAMEKATAFTRFSSF